MNKKQKKVLVRIIIAAVLMIILHFIPVKGIIRFLLYMVPYLVIGYDILKKAFKGIKNNCCEAIIKYRITKDTR